MVTTDQFGMLGLLGFLKAAETDPSLASVTFGTDLTALGLDLTSADKLYPLFAGPWSDDPLKVYEIDYPVPAEYLVNSTIRDKLNSITLKRYHEDTIFFLFYMYPNDMLQIAAAIELYSREWRYHKEEKVWITRAPGISPSEKTNSYERGTYYTFDAQVWRRVPREFVIEYDRTTIRENPDQGLNVMNEGCFFKERILISKDVDLTIEQITDYILRDYLLSWATNFVPDDENFQESLSIKIKNEIWILLNNLRSRMQDIDSVTFFTETLPRILRRHIEKFNLAFAHQIDENQHIVRFMVARHLEDDRAEIEFIRKVCEYLLRILLPDNYAFSDEFIFLIREVLTNHVFFNLIDYLCDPYFINNQAIVYGSVVGPVASSLETSGNYSRFTNLANCNNPAQGPAFLGEDQGDVDGDISDSIYDLVCEIFSLKKAQHWLRRTLIMFFQVAFGKTINKQLKDSVHQLTSDSIILDQLVKFRDSFWPDGVLAEPYPAISEDDKKLTYLLAKQYLINNIPDVFVNLIGQQNAKKGFLKVFEALQNKKANKQLFYDILEAFIIELSPELR